MRTVLLALFLAAPVFAQDPAWLPAFEAKLNQSGAAALEFLKNQPLDQRKTADHEWALARANQLSDQPEAAAMALVTYDILTRRHGRDVSQLRSWLSVKAQGLIRQAKDQLARGDRPGAVKSFLHAAIADQALIQHPAAGLRDETGRQLARATHDHPESANTWALLAGYHFHTGHLQASREAMNHYLTHDLDDYQRWRGEVWLSSIDHALDKHRKLAEMLMQQAAADSAAAGPSPDPDPEPPRPPEKTAEQKLENRLAKHRELLDLDARIRNEEVELRELQGRRRGQTVVTGRRSVGVVAYNQRQVKADIEACEKRLQELKDRRSELE